MMATKSLQQIKHWLRREKIEFVNLRTVDLPGHLHQVSFPASQLNEETLTEGVGFDGSSYEMAKVESSDMVLTPDLSTMHRDVFRDAPTVTFFADIKLTTPKRDLYDQDPRGVARRAEALLRKLKIADCSQWAPEHEFYIFNKVEYQAHENRAYYLVDADENFHQNAYHAVNPFDHFDDFRDQAVNLFRQHGIAVRYHHHESGKKGQQEIEGLFNGLLATSDQAMLVKYILFNLARKCGVHLTFMPKPLFNHAGSGWHLHVFLSRRSKDLFYRAGAYANLSPLALNFIGGVLVHARSLAAWTSPSTNSYKRLVPGFEAPVAITFGRSNRSSCLRIPGYVTNPNKTRVEYRPPDFTANPYLCLSAIMMAGIDGIIRKTDPVKEGFGPFDGNVFDESPESGKLGFLPGSLGEALDALEQDHGYLLRAGVFSRALIEQWTQIKRREIKAIATRPHPFEYVMYFDL